MISTRYIYIFPMPVSVLCFPLFTVHLEFCFFHDLGLAEKSFVLLHTRPLFIDFQGMRLLIFMILSEHSVSVSGFRSR